MPYGTSNKRWHRIRKDHGETHTCGQDITAAIFYRLIVVGITSKAIHVEYLRQSRHNISYNLSQQQQRRRRLVKYSCTRSIIADKMYQLM